MLNIRYSILIKHFLKDKNEIYALYMVLIYFFIFLSIRIEHALFKLIILL